jgi:hypothetical protein
VKEKIHAEKWQERMIDVMWVRTKMEVGRIHGPLTFVKVGGAHSTERTEDQVREVHTIQDFAFLRILAMSCLRRL